MEFGGEMKSMLLGGFVLILISYAVSIIFIWYKTKNAALLWFMPQLILLPICFYFLMRIMFNPEKLGTLGLILMGAAWLLIVLCTAMGIYKGGNVKK